MLERSPIIDRQAAAVMGRLAELDRGDVIGMDEIESLAGVARYSETWTALVRRIKNAMLDERGVALWSVPSVGYKLCTKDEQLRMTVRCRERRILRQHNRVYREQNSLPADQLTNHQAQIRAMNMQHAVAARRMVKRQMREQRVIGKRSETTPTVGTAMAAQRKAAEEKKESADA